MSVVEFDCGSVIFWLNEIREKKFIFYDPEYGTFERGVARLEYDWIDLELNLCTEGGRDDEEYTDQMLVSYFCNVKGINGNKYADWAPAGYLDDHGIECEVDWNAGDWPEQLKSDMEAKLKEFVERFDLYYDKPNWIGDDHYFDVFDKVKEAD